MKEWNSHRSVQEIDILKISSDDLMSCFVTYFSFFMSYTLLQLIFWYIGSIMALVNTLKRKKSTDFDILRLLIYVENFNDIILCELFLFH